MDERGVATYFDTHADTYQTSRRLDEPWPMVDTFVLPFMTADTRLLDIGCGNGTFLRYVRHNSPVTDVIGLDISRGMLDTGGPNPPTFLLATATDLPFTPSSFDFIRISDVLHHVVGSSRSASKRKAEAAIADALALLRPTGTLLIKEQYYEGPRPASTLTPRLIHWSLSRLSPIVSRVVPDAHDGLVVSFYTLEELTTMIESAGGTIRRVSAQSVDPDSVIRRALLDEHGRIYFLVEPADTDR